MYIIFTLHSFSSFINSLHPYMDLRWNYWRKVLCVKDKKPNECMRAPQGHWEDSPPILMPATVCLTSLYLSKEPSTVERRIQCGRCAEFTDNQNIIMTLEARSAHSHPGDKNFWSEYRMSCHPHSN